VIPDAAAPAPAALVAEALRVNARYVEEVVIGWGLCPWAARAWNDGQVTQRVFTGAAPDAALVAAFVDELGAKPDAAIGLAIFPRVACTVGAWERFAERVRRARREFLAAAFHPEYGPPEYGPPGDGAPEGGAMTAARLVPFIRRTPDPTLQLVRASLLENLRGPISDDVARANQATLRMRGPAALEALLTEIRRDRDASYTRVGGRC
jgi:hypothetical protein